MVESNLQNERKVVNIMAIKNQRNASRVTAKAGNNIQVIAITSGKGGVGKTNAAINIAVALAKSGSRVLLMDADIGLANIDVNLGLRCKYNLSHVISGEKTISDIAHQGPAGIHIIPAASGVYEMATLSEDSLSYVIEAFNQYKEPLDYLIIDTAAGISDNVLGFLNAAHQIIVMICDEPTSMTDSYALIKVMKQRYGATRFHFLANKVKTEQQGKALYGKMSLVVDHYLQSSLLFLGSVGLDQQLLKANRQQVPIVLSEPDARSAIAFRHIAERISAWPVPQGLSGQIEFFVDRLMRT